MSGEGNRQAASCRIKRQVLGAWDKQKQNGAEKENMGGGKAGG